RALLHPWWYHAKPPQKHSIGLKSGINWANANTGDLIKNTSGRKGMNAGLSYRYRINSNINAGAEMLYSQKGFQTDLNYVDADGNAATIDMEFNYDYLSLPLKVGFQKGNTISTFVNIGVVPSILLHAETVTPAIIGLAETSTVDVTENVAQFDFAGLAEFGVNFQLPGSFVLSTSVAYQHSFTTVTTSEYFRGQRINHYGLSLSLGVNYLF
ncbi:hypothetical protein C9994_14785, partial [Marivirga lumbricoides]